MQPLPQMPMSARPSPSRSTTPAWLGMAQLAGFGMSVELSKPVPRLFRKKSTLSLPAQGTTMSGMASPFMSLMTMVRGCESVAMS